MKKRKIDFKISENGCFIVTSHRINGEGYAFIYQDGKEQGIHRVIYRECFGEIPEGIVVRHKCDNPGCINPEHLELGTKAENARDAVERGRNAFGEKNGRAKITNVEASMIKVMIRDGMTNPSIAAKMNINCAIVRRIRNGDTWTHVDITA